MTTEELIENSIFKIEGNGIYTQYLIPSEHSPLGENDPCGCWLLVFNSKNSITTWLEIYTTLSETVNSNSELNKVVCFEPVHQLDSFVLCQNRGFNAAYTTDDYAEFLEDGDCKPNEWIVDHIGKLNRALNQPFNFPFASPAQKTLIHGLIQKAFAEPNMDLKWTDEPFPWTLYLAPIEESDLMDWAK